MKKLLLLTVIFLLWLVPCQATVLEKDMTGANYKISYPVVQLVSPLAQNKINGKIEGLVQNFLKEATLPGKAASVFDYQFRYEDPGLISFTFRSSYAEQRATHGMSYVRGLVFNKNTGEQLPLQNFLKITAQQLEEEARSNLTSWDGKHVDYTWLNAVKRVPEDYYLQGYGKLTVMFQVYELAPYAYGPTCIPFTAARTAYYDKLNHYLP